MLDTRTENAVNLAIASLQGEAGAANCNDQSFASILSLALHEWRDGECEDLLISVRMARGRRELCGSSQLAARP